MAPSIFDIIVPLVVGGASAVAVFALLSRKRKKRERWECDADSITTEHDLKTIFKYNLPSGHSELTKEHFIDAFETIFTGIDRVKIATIFDNLDTDHSGTVDQREFVHGVRNHSSLQHLRIE